MYYKFDVKMTDDDYVNFNVFHHTKTQQGKFMEKFRRAIIITVSLIAIVVCWLISDSVIKSVCCTLSVGITMAVFLLRVKKDCERIAKKAAKRLIKINNKLGEYPYTPQSVMEFYDDCFTETANGVKTEAQYSAVKAVRILNGRYIFIHLDENGAYILPFTVFESNEHCTAFIDFLRSKIKNVNFY